MGSGSGSGSPLTSGGVKSFLRKKTFSMGLRA